MTLSTFFSVLNELNNIEDIRFVFHTCTPPSISRYIWETSCAGSDGSLSYCVLFFANNMKLLDDQIDFEVRSMSEYGINGDSSNCRKVMLGFRDITDEHHNNKNVCCDHCSMKESIHENDISSKVGETLGKISHKNKKTWELSELTQTLVTSLGKSSPFSLDYGPKDFKRDFEFVMKHFKTGSTTNRLHVQKFCTALKKEELRLIIRDFGNGRGVLGVFKTREINNDKRSEENDNNISGNNTHVSPLDDSLRLENKFLEQFKLTFSGTDIPYLKMSKQIEVRWLWYLPFVVFFEMNR